MLEEFEYIVERKPPAPICFGSKLQRTTNLIGKGLSPFQKLLAPELFPNGPGHYRIDKLRTAFERMNNKVWSNKGTVPLVSGAKRFPDTVRVRIPSPTRYDTDYQPRVKLGQQPPFGSLRHRFKSPASKTPGPGIYNVAAKKCRRTRFMHNLGNPTMVPTIEMNCVSRPSDTCVKCAQFCSGDYWQQNHVVFLCHLCFEEEKRGGDLYQAHDLKPFRKIRNCGFAHDHENTTAAIRLLPPRKVTKKLRLENYLDLYLKC